MTLTVNKCKTCARLDSSTLRCRLNGVDVDPNEDFCSQHAFEDSVNTCDICGRKFIGKGTLTVIDGKVHINCQLCDRNMGTCATCKHNTGYCAFYDKTVHPELSPVIMVERPVPGGTARIQQRNEERQKVVCSGCKCWNDEFKSCKETNTCKNYEVNFHN